MNWINFVFVACLCILTYLSNYVEAELTTKDLDPVVNTDQSTTIKTVTVAEKYVVKISVTSEDEKTVTITMYDGTKVDPDDSDKKSVQIIKKDSDRNVLTDQTTTYVSGGKVDKVVLVTNTYNNEGLFETVTVTTDYNDTHETPLAADIQTIITVTADKIGSLLTNVLEIVSTNTTVTTTYDGKSAAPTSANYKTIEEIARDGSKNILTNTTTIYVDSGKVDSVLSITNNYDSESNLTKTSTITTKYSGTDDADIQSITKAQFDQNGDQIMGSTETRTYDTGKIAQVVLVTKMYDESIKTVSQTITMTTKYNKGDTTPVDADIVEVETITTDKNGKTVSDIKETRTYATGKIDQVVLVTKTFDESTTAVVKTVTKTTKYNKTQSTPLEADIVEVDSVTTDKDGKKVTDSKETRTYDDSSKVDEIVIVTNTYNVGTNTVIKKVQESVQYNKNHTTPRDDDVKTSTTITYDVNGHATEKMVEDRTLYMITITKYTPTNADPSKEKYTNIVTSTTIYNEQNPAKVVKVIVESKKFNDEQILTETVTVITTYNGTSTTAKDGDILVIETNTMDIDGNLIQRVSDDRSVTPKTITTTKFDAKKYVVSIEVLTPSTHVNKTTTYTPTSPNYNDEKKIKVTTETTFYDEDDVTKLVKVILIIEKYDDTELLTETTTVTTDYTGVSTVAKDADVKKITTETKGSDEKITMISIEDRQGTPNTLTTTKYNTNGNILSIAVLIKTFDDAGTLSKTTTVTTTYNGSSKTATDETKTGTTTVIKEYTTTTIAPVETTTSDPTTTTSAPNTTAPATTSKPKSTGARLEFSLLVIGTSLFFSLVGMIL